MTTHYSLRIVGLHYAANPTYRKEMGSVPEMEQHTVEVLRNLDEKRPRVMLLPNPDNDADPHAVMARAAGQHIGYVEKVDRELFYKLLKMSGKKSLLATIRSVEVEHRGKLCVSLEAEEGAEGGACPWQECAWPEWPGGRPLLPPCEEWNVRYEAEYMMDNELWPLTSAAMAGEMEFYLGLWMESSLCDISEETFATCARYIARFAAAADPRVRSWAARLDKFRTAFYGAKRDALRMEWWESLQQSESVGLLWGKWQYHCSYHLRRGLREVDDYLRSLPDGLYSLIGLPDKFFRALFYRAVPRRVLWGIFTALLVRIRTCRALGIGMGPLSEDSPEYGDAPAAPVPADGAEAPCALPEVLCSPEAVRLLGKLTEAGLVDACWQPIGLTFTEKGTLIDYVAERLCIRSKWKLFGALWNVDPETLRTSKARGLEQDKTWKFRERLEAL